MRSCIVCIVCIVADDSADSRKAVDQSQQAANGHDREATTSVMSPDDASLRRECSSDADSYRPSGIGILEFSPDRAGLDVTPANLYSGSVEGLRRYPTALTAAVAGIFASTLFCIHD